jgi:hypothetical protein
MEKEFNNNVTVNILELSSEIANKRLIQLYEQFYPSKTIDEIENMIMIEDLDNGTFIYTEHAQDLFNQLYDEYFTLIENLAI